MAEEYKLSFSADEIDNRLKMAGNAILYTEQTLTDEQKAQVRINLGIDSTDEDVIIEDIEYSYDGDNMSDKYFWVNLSDGSKGFAKVADLPEGEINLIGGHINVINPNNHWVNYSFDITEEMLSTSVMKSGVEIPAVTSGLTQIIYQGFPHSDSFAVAIICTKAGYYDIAFESWMEQVQFLEKGVYLFDNRQYGGSHYAESLVCTVTTKSSNNDSDDVQSPIEYKGNEIQVFNRGICIGDSITEGVFNHIDGEVVIKKYSYPSILNKITGIDIVNAGVAGLTSQTWYEASLNSDTQYGRWVNNEWVWSTSPEVAESDTISTSLDYSGFDFAVIHLGINDIGMLGDLTVDEAITKFETNINNIVSKLKISSNGIKIFLATIIPCYAVGGNSIYESLNNKIREIANATEDMFLIDLNEYSECFDGTAYENQHLTAIGYHKMASEIASYISYIISKNLNEFKWVQFTNTPYNY